jgi:hypothetical protein
MALQNADYLIVERSNQQYKITALDIKKYLGTNYVVADIAARDALGVADGLSEGDRAYVVDASADGTITSGGAEYIYDNLSNWVKVTEIESLDLTGATPTNLGYVSGTGEVTNDNGSGFTIPLVNGTTRGLATSTMFNNDHVPAEAGGTTSTNPVVINVGTQQVTFNITQLTTLP